MELYVPLKPERALFFSRTFCFSKSCKRFFESLLWVIFIKEIEVKILNVNKKEVEKKLLTLGAEKSFEDYIEAIYYNLDHKNKENKKTSLRLRKKGKQIELTFKNRLKTKTVKICEETEVNVSDFENMKLILKNLGYKIKTELKKHRTEYKLKNISFELDTYINEPTLLEIEAPDKKTLEKYVKILGFTMNEAKGWSYAEILKYYKEKSKKRK